jgi:hypothetical protein
LYSPNLWTSRVFSFLLTATLSGLDHLEIYATFAMSVTMSPEGYEIPDSDQEDDVTSQPLNSKEPSSEQTSTSLSATADHMEGFSMDSMQGKEPPEGLGQPNECEELEAWGTNQVAESIKLTTTRLADVEEELVTVKGDLKQMEEYDDNLESQYPAEDPTPKTVALESGVKYYTQCLQVVTKYLERPRSLITVNSRPAPPDNSGQDSAKMSATDALTWPVETSDNTTVFTQRIGELEAQVTELQAARQQEQNLGTMLEEQARRFRNQLQKMDDQSQRRISEDKAIEENARAERTFRIKRARLYKELRKALATPGPKKRVQTLKKEIDAQEEERMGVWWNFVEEMEGLGENERIEMLEYRKARTRLGRQNAGA